MPDAIASALKNAPMVLTPPTGNRRVSGGRGSNRQRRKDQFRDILRVDPTPYHLMVAAALYWATPSLISRLQNVSLSHDALFSGVVYLMWSGSHAASEFMPAVFDAVMTLELAAAGVLVASALLPDERMFAPVHAIARRLYRYAIAIPLWTIVVTALPRFIADQIYSVGGFVSWDLTRIFVKIESPVIERLQHSLASSAMSVFASNFYAAFWVVPIVCAGFALAAADKSRALTELMIAYLVAAICAVPLFILLPTFDPWTTNRIYGAIGSTTSIKYLYTNPSISTLGEINARYHWAAGGALPSLHVALPLAAAFVFRRNRLRWASWFMAAMAVTSMFVVVYLGRNWILCTLAAIPFAMTVATVTERIRLTLVLKARRKPEKVLRPGEIAVPIDPNVRVVEWYSAMFLLCAFAGVLEQIAWQRALFDIMGPGTPTAAIISTAVMLGLGTGFFIGARISRETKVSAPAALSVALIAVGLLGIASMPLFHAVAHVLSGFRFGIPAIFAFVALLPPSVLAGAMVPVFVMNHVGLRHNIGDAVGRLIFTGGVGAAAAAAFASLVLLAPLGLTATAQFAGAMNIGVGIFVVVHERRLMIKR